MSLTPLEMQAPDLAKLPDPEQEKEIAGRSPFQIAMGRLRSDKVALVCLAIVILFILIALFAPLLTKLFGVEVRAGDPSSDTDIFNFPVIGPPDHPFTWEAPLGLAPDTGDDNLAEWFYGARTSLMIASVSTIVATLIGITIGLIAGFSRGFLDRFISFIIDVFLSLPFLVMALAVAPIIVIRFAEQPEVLKYAQVIALILILIFFGWMQLARLIRGEVLSLREREFIQAARVMGVPTRQILFKELLPNMIAPIVVSFSLTLPAIVAAEAGLSYLGIGVIGVPSWGQTVLKAVPYFDTYPLYLYAPVIGIFVLVVALNLLGDAIRDAFDPKTRR
jgi:ABC-type dipeptide/oligopeptide/nickel transport system permease subunit